MPQIAFASFRNRFCHFKGENYYSPFKNYLIIDFNFYREKLSDKTPNRGFVLLIPGSMYFLNHKNVVPSHTEKCNPRRFTKS